MISSRPDATASSTTYWMVGLSTSGSISLGWALVAGRKRVPRPAAGNTAFRTFIEPDNTRGESEMKPGQAGGASSGVRTWMPSFLIRYQRLPGRARLHALGLL